MTLKLRVNVILFIYLAILAGAIVSASAVVVGRLALNSNVQAMKGELDQLHDYVAGRHEVLVQSRLDKIPNYIHATEKEIYKTLSKYSYGETGRLWLLDSDGAVLCGNKKELGNAVKATVVRSEGCIHPHEFRIGSVELVGVCKKFEPWGWTIFLVMERGEILQDRQAYLRDMLVLASVFVLFIIGTAYVLSQRTMDRVGDIVECVKSAKEGDLSSRIDVVRQNDELGELEGGINLMLNARSMAEEDLRKLNEELEDRVRRRTEELQSANAALSEEVGERRKAESEARDLQQRIEFVLGATKTGLDIIDSEYTVKYVDPYWAKVYGDYTGRKCHDYFLEQEDVCENCTVARALADKKTVVGERPVPIDKDRVMLVTAIPFQRDDGEWAVAEVKVDITERKRTERELEVLNRELQHASVLAGMSEVASGVLHNVGNVLNSVNVSCTLISEKAGELNVEGLEKAIGLLRENENDMARFFEEDPRGATLLKYLEKLAEDFAAEKDGLCSESVGLNKNVEHIRDIIRMQQDYAMMSGFAESFPVEEVVEDALRMNAEALRRHNIEVVRQYSPDVVVRTMRHKVLQILANLVSNAKYAISKSGNADRRLVVSVGAIDGNKARLGVRDSGVGILPENMDMIFKHGFTTRQKGHGFGLHSSALSAKSIGGNLSVSSEGEGRGAEFVLVIPLDIDGA